MGRETEFYKDLSRATPETIELSGNVLINKNGSTWHVVKKGAVKPEHACGGSYPYDPTKGNPKDKTEEKIFERDSKLISPEEALEQEQLCGNCKPMIKDRFDLERVVVAVPTDGPIDEAMRRANERIVEETNRKT